MSSVAGYELLQARALDMKKAAVPTSGRQHLLGNIKTKVCIKTTFFTLKCQT